MNLAKQEKKKNQRNDCILAQTKTIVRRSLWKIGSQSAAKLSFSSLYPWMDPKLCSSTSGRDGQYKSSLLLPSPTLLL